MHAELCRLLAVVGCPSLEHKAFAMQCLQHALLAYRTPSDQDERTLTLALTLTIS
jgi:hypothetical protein